MNSTVEPKRIFAATKKRDELELLVYDSIGESFFGGGVTAEAVKRELNAAGEIKKISMRINSPGGDVFEAAAIYSLLAQHKAQVHCYVDGLAASAAFTIAMSADRIYMSDSAMMMCHNAAGFCLGEAFDMRKVADTLDKVSGVMREIYSKRSGLPADQVQNLMDEETWMTAEEACKFGFADQILALDKQQAQAARAIADSYDLSKFSKKAAHESDDAASSSDGGWESRLESRRRELQLQEFAVSPRARESDSPDWKSRLESRRRELQLLDGR